MNQPLVRFVVVIHPDGDSPSSIINALNAVKAVALHVMPYSDWLASTSTTEHILLCIRPDGEWIYAENKTEKEELRKKIAHLHEFNQSRQSHPEAQ